MMLELHRVTIRPMVNGLSLRADSGTITSLTGTAGTGKTTVLRAVLGFIPVDDGHITIDGELLTPLSAPFFRRMTAYVPQRLTLPDGYAGTTDYVELLVRAVHSGKPLLIVDEPSQPLSETDRLRADELLREAARKGATVLTVNSGVSQNTVSL